MCFWGWITQETLAIKVCWALYRHVIICQWPLHGTSCATCFFRSNLRFCFGCLICSGYIYQCYNELYSNTYYGQLRLTPQWPKVLKSQSVNMFNPAQWRNTGCLIFNRKFAGIFQAAVEKNKCAREVKRRGGYLNRWRDCNLHGLTARQPVRGAQHPTRLGYQTRAG